MWLPFSILFGQVLFSGHKIASLGLPNARVDRAAPVLLELCAPTGAAPVGRRLGVIQGTELLRRAERAVSEVTTFFPSSVFLSFVLLIEVLKPNNPFTGRGRVTVNDRRADGHAPVQ